jgi:hypothetical protein
MARVRSDLYWQLTVNFFETMRYFKHDKCALLICISDSHCISKCANAGYHCFDYQFLPDFSEPGEPYVVAGIPANALKVGLMEQIASIKLKHVARVLSAGVSLLLLDLDVGFLRDPALLSWKFDEHSWEQMRSQMDVSSSMSRPTPAATTEAKQSHLKGRGRGAWYTHPRPNFGLLLVKGTHPLSAMLFKRAWRLYRQKADASVRARVATDQNYLVNAVKWANWRGDYNFSFFSLGYALDRTPRPVLSEQALLLERVGSRTGEHTKDFELGGSAARAQLDAAVAVHATCYEVSTLPLSTPPLLFLFCLRQFS